MPTLGDYLDTTGGTEGGKPEPPRGSGESEKIAGFTSGSFTEDSNSGTWIGESPIAPELTGESTTGTPTGKRRGRPPGTKNKSQAQALPADLAQVNQRNLAGLITTAHVALANVVGIPEIGALTEQDAKEYADNVTEVAKYYVREIDPKSVAIFNLVSFQCGLYIRMYREHKAHKRPAIVQMPKTAAPKPEASAPAANGKPVFVVPPGASGGFDPGGF